MRTDSAFATQAHGIRARTVLAGAALLAVVVVAFLSALQAPFVSDDIPAIVDNTSIRALWPPSIPLTTPPLGTAVSGRPVANYSFAVDYAINRLTDAASMDSTSLAAPGSTATLSFHLTNLFLHLVATLLVFLLARDTILRFVQSRALAAERIAERRALSAGALAFVIAALWAVHPLQTEAVDYVSQRTEVLVSVFYLLTLYAALRAWNRQASGPWSLVALVASALGMATKEVMITAPLMVVLFDRAFICLSWRGPWKTPVRRNLYIALFATTLISLGLVAAGARSETVSFHGRITWYQYALSQAWVVLHYLRLVVWPARLTYDYGSSPILGPLTLVDIIVVALLFGLSIYAWTQARWRWAGFLATWFFVLLAPSSSIVPIQTEIAAERRVYLALASIVALLVIAANDGLRRFGQARGWVGPVLGVSAVATLTARSVRRSQMYSDPELLYRDALREQPDNPRAYNGVAVAILLNDSRRLAAADTFVSRALAIDSTYVSARITQAKIEIMRGRLSDAERVLLGTMRFEPNNATTNQMLGAVLVAEGQDERAVPYLVRLDKWRPDPRTLTNLGVAYLTLGQLDSAVSALSRALKLDPGNVQAEADIGGALIESNRGAEAIPYLTAAVRANPSSGFVFGVLSVAYAQAGESDLAHASAVAAVERSPNDEPTLVFAGRGLLRAGRPRDAEPYLVRAVKLQPNDPLALARLAITESMLQHPDSALRLANRAFQLAPNDAFVQSVKASLARGK